ncbi:hypothetical protein F5Y06DRAFT_100348 [Hypoxylon sp. FL0890]|nr:hypothetical protein F5Y06DRAFT_100348 [Hypoxylon sp. FL0890]
MAQSSHGWQGHPYPNGIGSLPASGDEAQLNQFNTFQQYASNNPYNGAESEHQFLNHTTFSGYPSLQSRGDFGGDQPIYTNSTQQPSYYNNNIHHYQDSNAGNIHNHNTTSIQQYRDTHFNPHPGYDTPFQNSDIAPTAFNAQSWQGPPVQQVQPQFDQRAVVYDRNPQLMYQHQPQVTPYTNIKNAPSGQSNAFFNSGGFGPRSDHGHFNPQPPQQMAHYQSEAHAGRVCSPFQPVYKSQGPIPTQQHQQAQVTLPALPPQSAEPQVPAEKPQVENDQSWERLEGCPFLLVKNPPKTKISTFGTLGPLTTSGEKPYAAKHDTRVTRLLPQRGYRLPCEIQKEFDELNAKLQSSTLSPTERSMIEREIQKLRDEPIIVADNEDLAPGSQGTKAKTSGTKRKASSMDSAKKSGSVKVEEESAMDTLARQIKANPRPKDNLKAVEYDVIKILWRDPKLPELSQKAVGDNVRAFGDYVTALWTKVKDLKNDVEKAEAGSNRSRVESLRAALENTYDEIRVAIESAIKFGDKFTITQLGIHTKLLGSLCILLRNRLAANDHNGPLPKAILKLVSLFVTVDTEFLTDRVKLDRVQQKYKDNLDEEASAYMNLIFENGKKRSALKAQENHEVTKKGDDGKKVTLGASKKASTARDTPPTSKASPLKKELPLKKPGTEIKKMQPIDYSGLGSARKISNVTTKAAGSQASSKRPGDEDVDTRATKKAALESETDTPSTNKAPSTTSTTTTQAPSAASTQARSRPTGSMLPGRSRIPSKAQPKKATPQQSTASSTIGDILAQISKPKEQPKQQDEPEKAPETPEEAAKRLRKESRRHLRVSWKPDGELTDIRIFEHDTAEDKGRDLSMLRDARDNRSEGQMLKQRIQDDDDDPEDKLKEISIRPWNDLTVAEVSGEKGITLEQQEKNYVTRGGKRPVESEQKRVMEEYESRELMAIYTSVSEIPETPQSPTGKIAEVGAQPKIQILLSDPTRWQQCLPATTPKRVEIHQRWFDDLNFTFDVALNKALRRLKSSPNSLFNTSQNNSSNMSRPRTEQEHAAEVLALLKSDKVKNYVDPEPFDPAHPKTHRRHDYADPKVQQDIDALEDVFAKFKGKPFPPTEPPEHIQSNPARLTEWYISQHREPATKMNQQQPQFQPQPLPLPQPQTQAQTQAQLPDFAAILQQVQALQAGQAAPQPISQPIIQPTQVPVAPSPAQPGVASVQHLLAALNGTPSQPAPVAAPAPIPAPVHQDNSVQNILAMLNQQNNATPNPAQVANAAYYPGWPQSQTQAQTTQSYGGYGYNAQGYGAQPKHSQSQPSQPQNMQTQGTQSQRDGNERGNRKDHYRGNKDPKGINRSLIGTKACSFWAKGQCAKGDKCTFRHDPNDLK